MLGPILLNLLAMTRWVGSSPQYNSRPTYRRDYGLDYNGQRDGDYTIRGYISRPYDYDGQTDDRSYYSRNYPAYRRSYDGYYGRSGETCPYQNEKLSRKKREAETEDTNESLLLTRLRRQSFQSLYGRRYYNDNDHYNDNYYGRNYGRNYERDYGRNYGRYDNRRYGGRGRAGYDNCGREVCDWEAELVCPLGYDLGRIVWTREHDAYYPRDKYKSILDYCGGRCDPDGDLLRIRNVQPEDKGTYRCYIDGGDERDFKVVQFQPKFPVNSNSNGLDC